MEDTRKATSGDKLYDEITKYRDIMFSAARQGQVDRVLAIEPEFMKLTSLCNHTYPNGKIAYTYVFDKPLCMICVRKNFR
jgi:hypothetical protein